MFEQLRNQNKLLQKPHSLSCCLPTTQRRIFT